MTMENLVKRYNMRYKWNDVVVITDVKWRKSLSAIRSIGKNNNFIVAVGNSIFDMGLWSSYVNKRIIISNIKDNHEKYKEKIIQILDQCYKKYRKRPILIAMEDETLNLLMQNSNIVNKCKWLFPNIESFVIANNKFMSLKLASELGIDVPYTKQFDTATELIQFLRLNLKKDWVVKPQISKGSFGLTYISKDFDEVTIKKHWKQYGKLIVQDRIPLEGESICVGMIFSKTHKLIDYFVYMRLRTYPVKGGPSTCRVSISNLGLVKKSSHIMEALKWTGVVMLEWKKDIRDDSYKLIEINPRFWGSLELGIKCGVNFPQHYVDLSSDREVTTYNQYPLDVLSRWVIPGDILWLLSKKHKTKKNLYDFFHHIIKDSDEWDKTDISGSLATVFCQFVQVLNPQNWRFLRR